MIPLSHEPLRIWAGSVGSAASNTIIAMAMTKIVIMPGSFLRLANHGAEIQGNGSAWRRPYLGDSHDRPPCAARSGSRGSKRSTRWGLLGETGPARTSGRLGRCGAREWLRRGDAQFVGEVGECLDDRFVQGNAVPFPLDA